MQTKLQYKLAVAMGKSTCLLAVFFVLSTVVRSARFESDCSLTFQTVDFSYTSGPNSGCKGSALTYGCRGKCESSILPRIYNKKKDAPQSHSILESPFKHSCDCCSIETKKASNFEIELTCEDGTNRTTFETVYIALKCMCERCEFLPRY